MNSTAQQLDAADRLRPFRDEFHLPRADNGAPLTYLCGHSLGLQPKAVREYLHEELTAWQTLAVEAHFSAARPWVNYHERFAAPLAALVGAQHHEVVAMNSLSVNLHLLLASFYRPTAERHKILIERSAFPSDRYAVASQIHWHGFDAGTSLVEIGPRDGEALLRSEDICSAIEREASLALVLLPGVQYLTGQWLSLSEIARAARRCGIVIGMDLAHAIGNVPLALHDDGVDFAVWCSYKYLNAGPGAIGGAFVHERYAHAFDLPRLAGWWGHDKTSRFAMPQQFAPLPGAEGWQVSNPPIFAMAPLLASLDLFARAGMQQLCAKSQGLTDFLAKSLSRELADHISIVTPLADGTHGAQLSLTFNAAGKSAATVGAQLARAGIICDVREPNVLRLAPVPLYNSYCDAQHVVDALKELFLGENPH